MGKRALIIVDVQNDFCPGGALAVSDGDKVVEPFNEMVDLAVRGGWVIVASRDWHPLQTRHFQTGGGLWPVHCVQDTRGAEFHPNLKVENAIIVSKGMDPNDDGGYSAFDGETENDQSLEEILRENGVTVVFVGGLATDYCVKATALDARRRGFQTVLLTNASKAVNLNPGDVNNLSDEEKAIREMKAAGVMMGATPSEAD